MYNVMQSRDHHWHLASHRHCDLESLL